MGKSPKTILVTGFGPFPGAPLNPTEKLMNRLPKRLGAQQNGVNFRFHTLPTTWAARHEEAAELRESPRPDAIVHFGVDGTRRTINVETMAVNRATQIRPDAAGRKPHHPVLGRTSERFRKTTLPAAALRDAALPSGAPARLSTNAGTYLCNATLWDSLGSGIPSIFIHVPSLPKGRSDSRPAFPLIEEAAVRLLRRLARRLG